jgi:hypothetical protein
MDLPCGIIFNIVVSIFRDKNALHEPHCTDAGGLRAAGSNGPSKKPRSSTLIGRGFRRGVVIYLQVLPSLFDAVRKIAPVKPLAMAHHDHPHRDERTNPIQLTKEFFMKQIFRNTEDLGLFHLSMFQRREL